MKKRLIILFVFIALLSLWYGEKRSFYCLDNNKCITVWKTYGNTCYIIPDKYYGLFKPSDNYIETSNTNDITIYWSEKLPKSVIVRCETNYEIKNVEKVKISIHDFNDKDKEFREILYGLNPKKFSDVKSDVSFISIYIKEKYATDKNGKKL